MIFRNTWLLRRRDDALQLRNNRRCGVRVSSANLSASHVTEPQICNVECYDVLLERYVHQYVLLYDEMACDQI